MDCILFRHGVAVEPDEWGGPERERPLTPKGIDKTRRAVKGLATLKVMPTHLLSSPYTRAMETATLLNSGLGLKREIRRLEDLEPGASPEKLFPFLQNLSAEACVVCVGHEPHLGALAGVMLFGRAVPGLSLKKAGACCITFEAGPKPGQGVLRWWLPPSQLRGLA